MWKKIVFGAALIVSATLGFFAAKAQVTVTNSLNKVEKSYDTSLKKVDLSGITVNSDTDVVNILLVGNDYRKEKGYYASGLTDTMLIATLDKKHGTLKLTSLMRDMLVEIPGHGKGKLNAANSYGGIQLLYKTIAKNYGIKLDGYVEVSFKAFQTLVNDVGGVEVTLTKSEADYLNTTNYISNKKYRHVKVGKQILNGNQALGYCRIRKTVFTITGLTDDYGRTWRQRTVISAVFDKVKKKSISKWIKIANDVLSGNVKTDLSNSEIIGYMKDVVMIGTLKIHQLQIPIPGYYSGGIVQGLGSCLVTNKTAQSEALNQFIFKYDGKKAFKYKPSPEAKALGTGSADQ